MAASLWKVGELARQTGLSIRTLHYYDEIGLLTPSYHTDSGHRLYTTDDIVRLQQIKSLRQLGFALEQVRECLAGADFSPLRVIQLHLAHLRGQIEAQQRLCERLTRIAAGLESSEEVSAEEFIRFIEDMNMIEKYYTPEQLEELKQRAAMVGEARIREVEAEWPRLIAEVRAEFDKGTDPADPKVQALARRWMALVEEFTGGNPQIAASVKKMWQEEPSIHGMDTAPMRELMGYVTRAIEASKKK